MPKKFFRNGSKSYGSKSYKKTRYSSNAKSNAYKLDKKFKKKIKKIDDLIELKRLTASNAFDDVDTTGDMYTLVDFANGTTSGQTVGAEVRATSVQIKGSIMSGIDAVTPQEVRMIVFWDKQSNGSNPPALSGPVTTSSTGIPLLLQIQATYPVYNPYNINASDRYKVLYDKTIVLNPRVVAEFDPSTGQTEKYAQVMRTFNIRLKLNRTIKAMRTEFSQGVQAPLTNNLVFGLISNSTSDTPRVMWSSIVYYKDA